MIGERILFKWNKTLFYRHQKSSILSISRRHLILGIESTFDDTGAAVIDDNGKVVSESLFTQANYYTKTGGVEAFKAQDFHRENLPLVINEAMNEAGATFQDLDAIATATKPGLYLCLKEGLEYSKFLISKHKLPFIPVHHMEAHLLTARMIDTSLQFPFLTLLISGGHCLLCVALELGNYFVLGKCLDKPPGAAIDRVARAIHPSQRDLSCRRNGKYLEEMAKNGDRKKIEILIPMATGRTRHHRHGCDFSFSGLLSNTMARLDELEESHHSDLAASFQHSLSTHVCRQVCRGITFSQQRGWFDNNNNKVLVASGGVACNSYIRNQLEEVCQHFGWRLLCPPPKLCTDNGVMIACLTMTKAIVETGREINVLNKNVYLLATKWTGLEYWRRNRGVSPDPMAERYEAKCDVGPYISDQVKEAAVEIPADLIV